MVFTSKEENQLNINKKSSLRDWMAQPFKRVMSEQDLLHMGWSTEVRKEVNHDFKCS